MDFSADGSFALASCEFSGQMVRIDLRTEAPVGYVNVGGSPQDVKLSPDGRVFYVANRYLGGVQLIDAHSLRLEGFIRTGSDAHGLYVSRDTRNLYVTDRAGGAVTVIDLANRRIVATWPVAGAPDMGGVSPDGGRLWVASRYTGSVLAISTRTGKLVASIPAGVAPHGVCLSVLDGAYRRDALSLLGHPNAMHFRMLTSHSGRPGSFLGARDLVAQAMMFFESLMTSPLSRTSTGTQLSPVSRLTSFRPALMSGSPPKPYTFTTSGE